MKHVKNSRCGSIQKREYQIKKIAPDDFWEKILGIRSLIIPTGESRLFFCLGEKGKKKVLQKLRT